MICVDFSFNRRYCSSLFHSLNIFVLIVLINAAYSIQYSLSHIYLSLSLLILLTFYLRIDSMTKICLVILLWKLCFFFWTLIKNDLLKGDCVSAWILPDAFCRSFSLNCAVIFDQLTRLVPEWILMNGLVKSEYAPYWFCFHHPPLL